MSKPVILVDGSSYLFRAFHALPPLTTSKGQPTGAIKGVANMLLALRKEYAPEYMAVIFDAKGKNFRHDLYPEYKATRPPMPDDLRVQIEPLHKLIVDLGLELIVEEGVEADDVIGTLAAEATAKGINTLISTGDKDMAQLVSEHVTLINTMSNEKLDRQGVIDKFGVPPERIVDYLALTGDKVDNVPGVDKCGPKTAVKWLQEYGSLDAIIAAADQVPGKIGENLRTALPLLPLGRQLVTIKTDCDLQHHLGNIHIHEPNTERLVEHYRELEFKSWLAQLLKQQSDTAAGSINTPELFNADQAAHPASAAPAQLNPERYETVLDAEQLDRWLDRITQASVFCIDTETTSLDYMEAEVVGISLATGDGSACYIPFMHRAPGTPEQLDRDAVLAKLKPLLEDESKPKIGQNLKYDRSVLLNHDITLRGIAFDTMLESYVLNATATRHDMDSLALKYLGHRCVSFEDIAGKGKSQLRFDDIALDVASHYAAEDADVTFRLHEALYPQLQATPSLQKVFHDIDMPLVAVLSDIERNGARIDSGALRRQSQELASRACELEKEAWAMAGEEFNLASPKQLGVILYEKLGIPIIKKTPTGAPSTAEAVLQELADDHALPRVIMEHRTVSKLKSTYTDKLPEMISPRTGRVHTSYQQAVTATGRLSSTDPNLQNIPARTDEGRRIRQAFVAEPGHRIVAGDYSQIELRIMAHLSGDKGLLDAFAHGRDIHRATAAEVWGVQESAVTAEQRRSAKAINFGLIYGMSAFGLAKQLGIGRNDAQHYIDIYFDRYPGVKAYMERTRSTAHETGFVETLFGRRLYLPEINARNGALRQAAERTAINAPMQGTAADIIKRAMVSVHAWITQAAPDVRMIMQVHDELVFEVPEGKVETTVEEIRSRMQSAAQLDVPLVVDIGVGHNWDEAH